MVALDVKKKKKIGSECNQAFCRIIQYMFLSIGLNRVKKDTTVVVDFGP